VIANLFSDRDGVLKTGIKAGIEASHSAARRCDAYYGDVNMGAAFLLISNKRLAGSVMEEYLRFRKNDKESPPLTPEEGDVYRQGINEILDLAYNARENKWDNRPEEEASVLAGIGPRK
jgi:hypothetical protein